MSCAALEGFSESLFKELDPSWNIKVIVIQPGGVRTQWARGNMLEVPFPPAYASETGLPYQFRNMNREHEYLNDPAKGLHLMRVQSIFKALSVLLDPMCALTNSRTRYDHCRESP